MASFADRFNSLKDQARQKIEALKEDEQIQKAWGQARQKYDEISESEAVQNALQKGQQALSDTRQKIQNGIEESKQNSRKRAAETQFAIADSHAETHHYRQAIAVLEQAINPDSDFYDEAQARIEKYQQMQEGRKKLIVSHKNLFPVEIEGRISAYAEFDGFTYLIREVEQARSIAGALDRTYADGVFYIIRMSVTNNGKNARSISASCKTLIDSQDREFQTSSDGQLALTFNGDKTSEIFLSTIQPGISKNISIVFDVATNATGLKLKVGGGLFSSGISIPLELL